MSRLPFIDWVRGFAVVAMVLWHTCDAWLFPGLRDGQGWLLLRFLGGLAAPGFLFLAGVSSALSVRPSSLARATARFDATSAAERARALRAALGRGLEVVLVGYLLRYQTWMIDAAAIRQLGAMRAWLPLGLGYAALVYAVGKLGAAPRKFALAAAIGSALCALGLLQVEGVAAGRLPRLLQVDVLQTIGMSLVLLACLEHWFGLLRRPALALGLGVAFAALTELVWTHARGLAPDPLAAYVARWTPPQGRPYASLFPLFPWFAYACVGASVGAMLRAHRAAFERITVGVAVLGAGLAALTSEAHSYINWLFERAPWLVHPGRVAFRVGIVLTLLLVGLVWANEARGRGRALLDYGKSSLRIYWAHMLFAYGVLGRPLQKSSSYGRWLAWVLVLLAGMWVLAQVGRGRAKHVALRKTLGKPLGE